MVAGWQAVALRSITAGQPSVGWAVLTHQPWACRSPSLGQKLGPGQIRDAEVLRGGSLPVITNGYEEPPYLLTLKRIWCPLSHSCLTARTALTVMLWGWWRVSHRSPLLVTLCANASVCVELSRYTFYRLLYCPYDQKQLFPSFQTWAASKMNTSQ